MRTIPRSLFKSYTKDLSSPIFELVFQHSLNKRFVSEQCRFNVMILDESRKTHLCLLMITSGEAALSPPFQHGFWLRGVQP